MKLLVLIVLGAVVSFAPANAQVDSDCSEGELLALEYSGEFTPPPALVAAIEQDLATIRFQYPEVAEIFARPDWVPGELLVGLTPDAWLEWVAGTFDELEALNASLGVDSIRDYPSIEWMLLDFAECSNPLLLVPEYEAIEGVRYAQPNHIVGDGNDVTKTGPSTYVFRYGWGDCPAGCINVMTWEFEVQGSTVTLLNQEFTPVPLPSPFDRLAIDQNMPNPFNPRTSIRFHVGEPGTIDLSVVDVRGRVVRRLESGFRNAGMYWARWDGLDDAGQRVVSGVYFSVLRQGDRVVTRKMALVE